jgi:L-lactate dehydrogenase complex protein LldF
MSVYVGHADSAPPFPEAARDALSNAQLRQNVRHATNVIRNKRAKVVNEMPDWEYLRETASAIKKHTLKFLDSYLEQFEAACLRAGGQVHWARDADHASTLIVNLLRGYNAREVIKVKTMTSDEIRLNAALEAAGISPHETDLADLIVQLGHDRPSHIVVPALHRNRKEIAQLFRERMNRPELGDAPEELTNAARLYLREKFLRIKYAISGANFAIAETGSVCVVESEGNGRMCVSLPEVLITLVGIEKIIPRFEDLEVFLQVLPRSATGERMNPYNSIWTGIRPGDGPREFHVVLLDNGRTRILADAEARDTLNCIRCGACLNACPVYRQTGGHAYGSVYAGPIGAILTPQLQGMQHSQSLPYASSLCGACYEVCPVKIDIPEILLHLRGEIVNSHADSLMWQAAMKAARYAMANPQRFSLAQKLTRLAEEPFNRGESINHLPGELSGWTETRDLKAIPKQSFRAWWRNRQSKTA